MLILRFCFRFQVFRIEQIDLVDPFPGAQGIIAIRHSQILIFHGQFQQIIPGMEAAGDLIGHAAQAHLEGIHGGIVYPHIGFFPVLRDGLKSGIHGYILERIVNYIIIIAPTKIPVHLFAASVFRLRLQ